MPRQLPQWSQQQEKGILPDPFDACRAVESAALPKTFPPARPLVPCTPCTPPPSYTESMADSKHLPMPISEVSVPGLNTPPEAIGSLSVVWQDLSRRFALSPLENVE
ncbi:hypothetical protein MKZ38_007280 [Zalerion maritima]|uniref:Uncharacterized protein n=1 Tax=Zalerion maritima TaxID=339359 RepID=A0AAD5RI42_9PEZI|nr:hypothetical protein MKZ38_007280 [Zalerion maritima]